MVFLFVKRYLFIFFATLCFLYSFRILPVAFTGYSVRRGGKHIEKKTYNNLEIALDGFTFDLYVFLVPSYCCKNEHG